MNYLDSISDVDVVTANFATVAAALPTQIITLPIDTNRAGMPGIPTKLAPHPDKATPMTIIFLKNTGVDERHLLTNSFKKLPIA